MGLIMLLVLALVAYFLVLVAFLALGRRIGLARIARSPALHDEGSRGAEAFVFGLLGLIIAFTFAGALSRLEARRQLVVEEANAIGTAWLRLDLLAPEAIPPLHDLFRRYTDLR